MELRKILFLETDWLSKMQHIVRAILDLFCGMQLIDYKIYISGGGISETAVLL